MGNKRRVYTLWLLCGYYVVAEVGHYGYYVVGQGYVVRCLRSLRMRSRAGLCGRVLAVTAYAYGHKT